MLGARDTPIEGRTTEAAMGAGAHQLRNSKVTNKSAAQGEEKTEEHEIQGAAPSAMKSCVDFILSGMRSTWKVLEGGEPKKC